MTVDVCKCLIPIFPTNGMTSIYHSCILLVTFIIRVLKFAFACSLIYFMGNLLALLCEIISHVLHQHEEKDVKVLEKDSFDF